MNKEMKNLKEHETFEEVRQERYMNVIPSLWVINRHTEDGKIDSGKIKARLLFYYFNIYWNIQGIEH